MKVRAALLSATLAAGCASNVRLDGARTTSPGARQYMIAPSGYVGGGAETKVVNLDFLFRVGLGKRVDLGVRAWLLGGQADLKVQLWRSSNPRSGLDVAVAPGIGVGLDATWSPQRDSDLRAGGQATLPLILGLNLGDHQLVLTPQITYQQVPALPRGLLIVAGTIALGPIEHRGFRAYPAVAVSKWVDAQYPGNVFRHGTIVVQPAVVFRWGS